MNKRLLNHMESAMFLKAELQAKILALPDNPRIERVSDIAFTVKASEMNEHLAAEYHNFKHVYELLAQVIDNVSTDRLYTFMRETIKDGYFMRRGNKVFLHPDIVSHLKVIMGD